MIWVLGALCAALVWYVVSGSRGMRALFSDRHIDEVVDKLPELKRRALAELDVGGSVVGTSLLAVAYTVRRGEQRWEHHFSISTPVTLARTAGLYFVGIVRLVWKLSAPPTELFVTQTGVFHHVLHMTDEEHAAFEARMVATMPVAELRRGLEREREQLRPLLRDLAKGLAPSSVTPHSP